MSLRGVFEMMKRGGYVIAPYEKYLLTKQDEDNDRAFNVNAPSSVGGCLRARFYGRKGFSQERIQARTQRIFDNGSMVHERIQRDLENAEILLMDEVPVFDLDYNIQGHTDGILKLKENELGILEIKSINSRQFGELKSEKEMHRFQGLCYLHCIEKHRKFLRAEYPTKGRFALSTSKRRKKYESLYQHLKGGRKFTREEKIDFQTGLHLKLDKLLYSCENPITKVVFLYENKDTQDLKEFVVSTDDEGARETIEQMLMECSFLNTAIETDTLPERPAGARKDSGGCRFCNYKDECFVL